MKVLSLFVLALSFSLNAAVKVPSAYINITEEGKQVRSVHPSSGVLEGHNVEVYKAMFKVVTQGRKAEKFLADTIRANFQRDEDDDELHFKMTELKDGSRLYVDEERISFKLNKRGELIYIYFNDEEDGEMPDYSKIRIDDDDCLYCFFQGDWAGLCTVEGSDETYLRFRTGPFRDMQRKAKQRWF